MTIKKKACNTKFDDVVPQVVSVGIGEAKGSSKPVPMDELEGRCDSLATAAVTDRETINSLVKYNIVLTKTNVEVSDTLKTQAKESKSLAASLVSFKTKKGGGGGIGGGGGREDNKLKQEQKWYPHWKCNTWHDANDCYELTKYQQTFQRMKTCFWY